MRQGGGRGDGDGGLVVEAARLDRELAEGGFGVSLRGRSSLQEREWERHRYLSTAGEGEEEEEVEGVGDGLSVCGALFALFLSACPLLGGAGAEVSKGVVGRRQGGRVDAAAARGGGGGWGMPSATGEGDSSGVYAVEGALPAVLVGAIRGGASQGFPSRVAVVAGELLQVKWDVYTGRDGIPGMLHHI